MFGIGLTEIIFIVVLALLILGPEKFPEMAKKAGKLFAQFQRMGREFKNTVAELDVDDKPKDGGSEAAGEAEEIEASSEQSSDEQSSVSSLDDLADNDDGDKRGRS